MRVAWLLFLTACVVAQHEPNPSPITAFTMDAKNVYIGTQDGVVMRAAK